LYGASRALVEPRTCTETWPGTKHKACGEEFHRRLCQSCSLARLWLSNATDATNLSLSLSTGLIINVIGLTIVTEILAQLVIQSNTSTAFGLVSENLFTIP